MILALLLALAAPLPAAPLRDDRIDKVMAATDGRTRETAYKVKSIGEEYEIVRRLGRKPQAQSLITGDKGKAYDMIETIDPATDEKLDLWFDISSFFGKEFGF